MGMRILLAIAGASLSLLATACSWPVTDANGWRYESGSFGDFQESYSASKGEIDGPGRIGLGCGGTTFHVNRGENFRSDPGPRVPARYRFDEGPWVEARALHTGIVIRFDAGGEVDPIYPLLAGRHRLSILAVPRGEEPVLMNFDLTGVDEAMRRVREHRTCRPS